MGKLYEIELPQYMIDEKRFFVKDKNGLIVGVLTVGINSVIFTTMHGTLDKIEEDKAPIEHIKL